MEKLVYIADPEVLAIPIVECGEPLVGIRDHKDLQYGSPPENEFTKDEHTEGKFAPFRTKAGHVSKELKSHRHPKLIAIDKQPNHNVMQFLLFGETDCLSSQAFNSSP